MRADAPEETSIDWERRVDRPGAGRNRSDTPGSGQGAPCWTGATALVTDAAVRANRNGEHRT